MAYQIIHADITTLNADAIVNPTDQRYSGGGGLDKQIHTICGQPLYEATSKLPKLHIGEARATESYGLPCKYIIHTSGPHWTGRSPLETTVLGSCYRNSLVLANNLKCKSIAFPLISSQGKHFPKEKALTIAINAIEECTREFPNIQISLVISGTLAENLSPDLFSIVNRQIHNTYIPEEDHEDIIKCSEPVDYSIGILKSIKRVEDIDKKCFQHDSHTPKHIPSIDEKFIEELINNPTQTNLDKISLDESFSQMLSRILKERNLPHKAVQDEIGMSTPGFWKLLTEKTNPSKLTVFGIAIALKLSIEDTTQMLRKAGYAINQSSLQDIIVSALIENKIYDRSTIDNLLYSLDLQPLPGAILDD